MVLVVGNKGLGGEGIGVRKIHTLEVFFQAGRGGWHMMDNRDR